MGARPKGNSPDSPQVTLNYRAQGPTLAEFHKLRNEYSVRNLIGPLGSAKTASCITEVLDCFHTMPPCTDGVRRSRWLAARNTYGELEKTTIHDFMEIADPMGVGKLTRIMGLPTYTSKYRRRDGTIVEAELMFVSFDGEMDDKKARSLNLSGAWLNEMQELAKSNVDIIDSRIGRYPRRKDCPDAWCGMISDSNMPDRDHWLCELAYETKPEGWWFGIQPPGVLRQGGKWITNPLAENLQNLPKNYYQRLIPGKKESWIRKNLGNEPVFVSDGRPVHPDFAESMHVMPVKPTARRKLHVGIDFGRTPAAAIMQRQDNGQWFVLREVVTNNMGAKKFGEVLKQVLNEEFDNFDVEFTGDPAGGQMAQTDDNTPFQMLELAGIYAFPCYTNDPEIRIEALDNLLVKTVGGQPVFVVDPSCTTIIKGLAGKFQFRRLQVKGDERYQDKVDKNAESHVCEAIHYGLLGAGEGDMLFNQTQQPGMIDDLPTVDVSVFE